MERKIAEVVIDLPVEGPFDYKIPDTLKSLIHVGQRVYVPFGARRVVGFVVGFRQRSFFKTLRPIIDVLDDHPVVDDVILEWAKEFADYYGCSWGEAVATFLPKILLKKTPRELVPIERKNAKKNSGFFLCHDLSLTKRWQIVHEHIRKILKTGRSVLILVPERARIPDIKNKILREFPVSCQIFDKTLTQKKEFEAWENVRKGDVRIIMGTRSSVFAPVRHLGIIIVFDEESAAFKQEQSPFYHIREVIAMRTKYEQCDVLYVSSSPTAELWHGFKGDKDSVKTFVPEHKSALQLIDMTNYQSKYKSIISFPLQNEIERQLNSRGKVILFLNRRGFTLATRCNACGQAIKCPRCEVILTFLYSKNKLVCHLCQHATELPKFCPHCKGAYLRSVGSGIEKIESNIARIFPQAAVAKYDRDTAKLPKGADIIIATQAVLKDIDKFKANLIAILDVESELHRFDFRSAHRVYSLIIRMMQAAREKVLVQTYDISQYPLQALKDWDYASFYEKELQLRKELGLPPFKHLVTVVLRGGQEEMVFAQAKDFYADLHSKIEDGIDIIEPQPDHISKLRNQYRFVIVLKGKNPKKILKIIKAAEKRFKRKKGVIITINVDS